MGIALEIGNLNGLLILIVAVMLGPPIVLSVIGGFVYKKNRRTAKIVFIIASVYLIISLGICGALIAGF